MRIKNFKYKQQFVLLGILVVLIIIMTSLSDNFFTFTNLTNILRQQSMVGITAAGATFVMIICGLDISVGSTIALSGVVFAISVQNGIPLWLALILAILVGGMVGLLNATMVVGAKINPVIATLGSMYAIRGVAFIVADGKAVVNGLPKEFMELGRGYIWIIPIPVVILLLTFIVFHFILSRTLLGKYAYAIGGNLETARLSGIPVKKIQVILYSFTGLLTGLSGAIMASRLNSGNPQIGQGFEFDVIVAVLLGGVSLKGGEGTLIGTLIGVIIIGVLDNGLNVLGINSFYQYIVKGLVLVIAVTIDMALKGRGIKIKSIKNKTIYNN